MDRLEEELLKAVKSDSVGGLSEIIVVGIGAQGKSIAEQIRKEHTEVSCFSFLDENKIAQWGENYLSKATMVVIASGMDDAKEEAVVAKLVQIVKMKKALAIAILGARGNNYTEIAENSGAVIICSKDTHISEKEQDIKMYEIVLGLVLANDPNAEVALNVLDIAAILRGECQFGVGKDKDASVAAKQAMEGLLGHSCLLYFFAPKGVSLYNINEAAAEVQNGLDEGANILFGFKEVTGQMDGSVKVVAYASQ